METDFDVDQFENQNDGLLEDGKPESSDNADLEIEITDAVSERDRIKYTIQTKARVLPHYEADFTVVRTHDDFQWLYDRLNENPSYAGLIIPPLPPRPEFTSASDRLQRLSVGQEEMSPDEFSKFKEELEMEYLAGFKKTVAAHDVFLSRLSAHPIFKLDDPLKHFLQAQVQLGVEPSSVALSKEKITGFWKFLRRSASTVLKSNIQDEDGQIVAAKKWLDQYYTQMVDASSRTDRVVRSYTMLAHDHGQQSNQILRLGQIEDSSMSDFYSTISSGFAKLRKTEARMASDYDLNANDVLHYYVNDCAAAQEMLYRRTQSMVEYDASNKDLNYVREKQKLHKLPEYQARQEKCAQRFQQITKSSKEEMEDLQKRRVDHLQKSFVELAHSQIKHSRTNIGILEDLIKAVEGLL